MLLNGPVLKYPGSKWRLANWIISNFPLHQIYLEPFFGGGAVLFNKKPSYLETVNDLDSNVVNLFKVIRDQEDELARLMEFTPFSREEFYSSHEKIGVPIEDARRFLVQIWQGFSGRTSHPSGWAHFRCVVQGGDLAARFDTVPERIHLAAKRLKRVQIECRPAQDLIPEYNSREVLIYADPPYVLGSRTGGKVYAHEMTDEEHIELLRVLKEHIGPVVLSGYDCELYRDELKGWIRMTKQQTTQKAQKREESLWLNPMAANAQQRLFS
jgi:DNA adenine methylase